MQFVNKERIIEAFILEPYTSDENGFDFTPTRGWQLHLVLGYGSDGYPFKSVINKETEKDCIDLAIELGLTKTL